jgi:hypothetical protein
VRIFDCLLASGALGATLFTLFVLGGSAGEPVPAPPIPETPAFRAIVLHALGGCEGVPGVARAHFFVTADGEVQPTVLWRRGEPIPSTGRPDLDRVAVVVAVEPSSNPRGQIAALKELLARLSERFRGIGDRVMTHTQVDGTRCGRSGAWTAAAR